MKRVMVVILGILIVMLVVFPAMAENNVDTEDDIVVGDTDGPMRVMTGRPPDTAPPDSGGSPADVAPCGIDSQSPVLDGSAFTSYDTVFVHGTAAITETPLSSDIQFIADKPFGHVTVLKESSGGYTDAWIYCPLTSYEKKTGGVQPMVRYLGLYYTSDSTGVGWPEVDQVDVYNGCTKVKTMAYSPAFHNWGTCTVQIIDLGEWRMFNRGLGMAVHIRSGSGYVRAFTIGGYGARFEW